MHQDFYNKINVKITVTPHWKKGPVPSFVRYYILVGGLCINHFYFFSIIVDPIFVTQIVQFIY